MDLTWERFERWAADTEALTGLKVQRPPILTPQNVITEAAVVFCPAARTIEEDGAADREWQRLHKSTNPNRPRRPWEL
jgi:hypothetical protein